MRLSNDVAWELSIIAYVSVGCSSALSQPNSVGDIINNQGIITQGQTGNNTIIQQEVPARALISGPDRMQLPDGKSRFVYRIDVTKPVRRLYLQAQGQNVDGFEVAQEGPISHFSDIIRNSGIIGKTPVRNISFSGAFGRYIVLITTSDGLAPMLAHKIE